MRALVIRLGAIGDMIILTPLLKRLKEDGYTVDVYCKVKGADIIRHNPNVNKFIYHDDKVKDSELEETFRKAGEGYDKVINLSGSLEKTLAVLKDQAAWHISKLARHEKCNANYYDHTLSLGGYSDTGLNGELHFTPIEESMARKVRQKHRGKFLILWVLSGSSYHKAYPYAEMVATKFLDTHPDAMILTVGDELCQLLEWKHPQTKNYSGIWPVRKSMIMTKYADLVIGPDTGILHAVGCYDTPKILLLTAASEDNIAKHWKNRQVLFAPVDCYPCHRLIYNIYDCPTVPGLRAPLCSAKISTGQVYLSMESVYQDWRKANGVLHRSEQQADFCRGRRDVLGVSC